MDADLQPVPLFSGVADEVNKALGVASYHHRGPFQSKQPSEIQGQGVAGAVFGVIQHRFAQLASAQSRSPSTENWRVQSPQLRPWNSRYPEVDLERRLIKARQAPDWWNQVPIASGLACSTADRRRCIDLVHDRGGDAYDFVELKVESDTPVFAAVEILQYGFVWLLSRHYRDALGYSRHRPTLLDAKEVNLRVFAPKAFYRRFDRTDFQSGLDAKVKEIAVPFGVTMSFLFLDFDLLDQASDGAAARAFLDQHFSA
jgi:hypothetical protein